MSLQDTPRSNRVHIGIFGLRNSGKSSLINALTNQEAAIVSDTAGTTTDPVYKSMEIHGIGPCVFVDTAGFDDVGEIGELRIRQTEVVVDKTDIAIMVFDSSKSSSYMLSSDEIIWLEKLKKKKIPIIGVMNKSDLVNGPEAADNDSALHLGRACNQTSNQACIQSGSLPYSQSCGQISDQNLSHICTQIQEEYHLPVIPVSTVTKEGIEDLRELLIRSLPQDYESDSITGGLVGECDVVFLVMPQDIQAPKGRLILPQVQVVRELLDKKCIVMSVTADKLEEGLASLKNPPKLIITDSQVFKTVYDHKPAESMLTSFSVLLAGYKGDLRYFAESANVLSRLTENSRVLIAEACTHAPLEEDIGRVKIPAMLRKRVGQGLQVDIVSGTDFPADISGYDLIIHCGGCMFNRKYVLSRVEKARQAHVPMSNYGVVIACLSGILEKISMP